MAKVLEGPGMGLLKKWGMVVPATVVVTTVEELDRASAEAPWLTTTQLVVKAHEAIGSRMQQGLVKVGLDLKGARATTKEFLGRAVHGFAISQVIVSEMVPHSEEYYVAVQSVRDGAEILLSSMGGIEIEAHWDRVRRLFVQVGESPPRATLEQLARDAGFTGDLVGKVADFAAKLFHCYDQEDGQYLEVNPLTIRTSVSPPQAGASGGEGNQECVALDIVMMLDGEARFRHPDWTFPFASEFGRPYTDGERAVMEVDAKIKASVKFIEIPGGDTALLPAGGGASVYYADAVVALGGSLANYAEYSGDPPDWAVEALTDRVSRLKGVRRIIVGGAIANFTNVKKTFAGIIAGLRRARQEGAFDPETEIWVRRGGPYEQEGLEAMRELAKEGFRIHVFDRQTPMTDIVDFALETREARERRSVS